jgi:excisionase family DNA binding protein
MAGPVYGLPEASLGRAAGSRDRRLRDFPDQILRKLGRKTVLVATLRTGSHGDRVATLKTAPTEIRRGLARMDGNSERLLTPGEVAALFRVDPKTVTRWAASGRISSIRTPGGHRRFRESEVRALLGDDTAPEPVG